MNISSINTTGTPTVYDNVPQKEPSGRAPEESKPVTSEEVKQMVEQIQAHIQSSNISVTFSTYGDKNREVSVIVKEKDTGKVIREIPPEDLQNLYTKLGELIGIIFHHSA
ncbi:MAG TPA: flagellar protein FlaG [Syntrophales bacterium]|nr:flagellar protein FlaG [Syntrophales bacterium]